MNIICRIFGHKSCQVHQLRFHPDGRSRKRKIYKSSLPMKYKGHYVEVTWQECIRCGKKLSTTHRTE